MVLGKRSRRAPFRPRKKVRRVPRPIKQSMVPSMNVTRTWWSANWSPNTTTTAGFWRYLTLTLSQMPAYTEYTALFDSYRINTIKYTFRPKYDSFAGNDTTDTTLPGVTNQGGEDVHVVIDPKSAVTPGGTYTSANLNSFLENGMVRTYRGTRPFSFTIKYPCFVDDVNNTSSIAFLKTRFLSTLSPGLVLQGAHVFIQDTNLTGVFGNTYDIFITANVTFKGQR